MAHKKEFVAGFKSEFLGASAGNLKGIPVALLDLRLNPNENFQSLTIMLDRPALERLVEDVSHLLATSKMLAKGEHMKVSLIEAESIHNKLTD